MTTPARTRILAAASVALLGLTLSACDTVGPMAKEVAMTVKDNHTVNVTLAEKDGVDTCTTDTTEVRGGPVQVVITNESAQDISEVELLKDGTALAGRERLKPGNDPVFFVKKLEEGDYQLSCPGAEQELVDLTVTAPIVKSAGQVRALLQQGASDYKDYITTQVDDFVEQIDVLDTAVQSGDVEKAKDAYAQAQTTYQKVEGYAEGFTTEGFDSDAAKGQLVDLISGKVADSEAGQKGMAAVENAVFKAEKITDTTKSTVTELKTNVETLRTRVEDFEFDPSDLRDRAADLLDQVKTDKIEAAKASPAGLQLAEFAAKVEGAKAAFDSFEPALDAIAPEATAKAAEKFENVQTTIDALKDPDVRGGFQEWKGTVKAEHAEEITEAVDSLREPLAKLRERVQSV